VDVTHFIRRKEKKRKEKKSKEKRKKKLLSFYNAETFNTFM